MSQIVQRLKDYIDYKQISIAAFEKSVGLGNATFNKVLKSGGAIGTDKLEKILNKYPEINNNWLLTGEGNMLQVESKGKIPVYDVASIGGYNDVVANVSNSGHISEWIEAGDWFPEATSAIHHYGDSMVEYPSGSILALKRVNNPTLILNGRNYVIETEDFRVTKQLQDDGGDYITAYSTNKETYPDGHLIHSPIRIPKESIRHIDLVLGCVTKEYSNGAIPIIKG